MTTVTTFHYSYFIRAAASRIYDHLSEPTNYIGLSPLLISLTDVQWDTNLQGQRFAQYKTVELFRFLRFITYQNPLDVVMTLTSPGQQIVSMSNQHSTFASFLPSTCNLGKMERPLMKL